MARAEAQYSNQGQFIGYQKNFKRAYVDFQGVETDPNKLRARQLQIDIGKQTPGYKEYCRQVPKEMRRRNSVMPPEPHTPDSSIKCSKRFFDGQIKKWRRDLHWYDPRNWEEEQYGTGELKPRGQQASAAHHFPDASVQNLPTTPQAGPSAIPIERATPEALQQKVDVVDKSTQAPTPTMKTGADVTQGEGESSKQKPLTDITNDSAASLKKDNSTDPFNDESLRNINWADDTADDTAIEGVPGNVPAHLRPIRTTGVAAATQLGVEGDENDKENSQQRSASVSRGNHSSHATAATGVSTATSDQGTGYKIAGTIAWEKLASSTDGPASHAAGRASIPTREAKAEAERKAASRRLVPDKLVQMQRQALTECVTFKPMQQQGIQVKCRSGQASGQTGHQAHAQHTGHYAKAVAGPPVPPLRETSYRPSEPRLKGRGNPPGQQSWGPPGKIPGMPPGFILEVDKQRTAQLLQAAGVRDPQRFVSEADKERLRLLRGEPNYLQNQMSIPGMPRQPRPIPIEVPSQAELPGFSRSKPWETPHHQIQPASRQNNATVYQQYDGLNDNDFLPPPSEARVDDSAAARYRIRSKTPKTIQLARPPTSAQTHSGRSSSASVPSLRSSGNTACSVATLATESIMVAESVGMTEIVEDDASIATAGASMHRPQSKGPAPAVRVNLRVTGDKVELHLKHVSWGAQPLLYRKGMPNRRMQAGGRQPWGPGYQQGNYRSRSAGPLQQLPEQHRMAVRVFQAGPHELQSVQPVRPIGEDFAGLGVSGGAQRLVDLLGQVTPVLNKHQGDQDVVRVNLPCDGCQVKVDMSVHARKRYTADLLASLYKSDLAIPTDLDTDLPRGHALKELFSKYNMRRQKPGRRIAPVSVSQPIGASEGSFVGKNATWAPMELQNEDKEWLRDPLARRLAGMPVAKGKMMRKPSIADQVDTWRSSQPVKRRIQPQQISQDQSKHNPILTQAPIQQPNQSSAGGHAQDGIACPLFMECSAEGLGRIYSVDGSLCKAGFGHGESGMGVEQSFGGLDCEDTAHDIGSESKREGELNLGRVLPAEGKV